MTDSTATAPMELDASELTYEEWFFLWAAFAQMPGAGLARISEFRQRALGMSAKEKQLKFRLGMEALMARGFIRQAKDKNGKLLTDPHTQQPIFEGVGRIITRTRTIEPVKQ